MNFYISLHVADPYFELLHDETDEPITESLVDPHENSNHSIETWKSKLTNGH